MAVIIFIILFALFACLNGDSSGVEAIAKVIGGVVLFIVVGSIIVFMMDNPAIIIGIIVLAVLAAIVYSLTKENKSKSTSYYQKTKDDYNTYNDTCYEEKTESLSDFQKELQQNTKTPQQVETIKSEQKLNQIYSYAESTYQLIKQEIMTQAKNANYTYKSGNKTIIYDYKFRHRPEFIGRRLEHVFINQSLFNPQGQYANKLTMFITDQDYYNNFMAKIHSLAGEDNISVKPLMIHKKNNSTFDYFPFTIQGFGVSEFDYDFVLRCIVSY